MGTQGSGLVLPAGSAPQADVLPAGLNVVTIAGFDDSGLIRCEYPDGFVKHCTADDVTDLLGKVTAQIKSRYGDGNVDFVSIPTAIEAGQTIEFLR